MNTVWQSAREYDGIIERRFALNGPAGAVPAILWTPANSTSSRLPLVLLGYGSGGQMRDESRLWQAGWLIRECGLAVTSMDIPGHGERTTADEGPEGYGDLVDQVIGEWRALLDTLAGLSSIDPGRVGYRGLSLGTMLGLPFVAAEPRVRAAVLGLADVREAAPPFDGFGARLAQDAPAVRCPVLFHVQWDDELIDRDSAFALFGLIGSSDKRMLVHPGGHAQTPQHAIEAGLRFLGEVLTTS